MTFLDSFLGGADCCRGAETAGKHPSGLTESFGGGVGDGVTHVLRKCAKRGPRFTLMVVGASGAGRSTFVNTLCRRQGFARKTVDGSHTLPVQKTTALQATTVELEEDGLKLSLTVVDTQGFCNAHDNEKSFGEVLRYIEAQFDEAMAAESRIRRNPKFYDSIVHALLYFIVPTGHSLRQSDVEIMKRLARRVNVIPVVGKADALTQDEMAMFKRTIMEDIARYEIPIYDFPFDPEEDDEETIVVNSMLKASLPFAVIGAEGEFEVEGRRVRGRKYPWGIAEVTNEKHCDYSRLRHVLLKSHSNELRSITHDVFYEKYRTEKLSQREEERRSLLQEEHLAREAVKLREREAVIALELETKRLELLAREKALRNLELRLSASQGNLKTLAR